MGKGGVKPPVIDDGVPTNRCFFSSPGGPQHHGNQGLINGYTVQPVAHDVRDPA